MEQIAQKYDFTTKSKAQSGANLYSIYISNIGQDLKTVGLTSFFDENGKEFSLSQRNKTVDIPLLTKQIDGLMQAGVFKGTGNIQNMLNSSIEIIKEFSVKLNKSGGIVFNRYFFFDGQDYSLDLFDAATNNSYTLQEANNIGVKIHTEIRYVNQTFSDESDLSAVFNKDARADIMVYFSNGFQSLVQRVRGWHDERVEKVKHLNQLFPSSNTKPTDDAVLRALEIYDDLMKSEGLLNEKLGEAEQRRQEIQKAFFDMKKSLWKTGMTTIDLEYYNKAMADFFKTCSAFDQVKLEMLKPTQESKAVRDKILEMKFSMLSTEIYKNIPNN